MLAGKQFQLERATLALGMTDGKRKAVTIPTGAVIKVVSAQPAGANGRDFPGRPDSHDVRGRLGRARYGNNGARRQAATENGQVAQREALPKNRETRLEGV